LAYVLVGSWRGTAVRPGILAIAEHLRKGLAYTFGQAKLKVIGQEGFPLAPSGSTISPGNRRSSLIVAKSGNDKKASKKLQEEFGHTPLSIKGDIPWKCRRLVVGRGTYSRLPSWRT